MENEPEEGLTPEENQRWQQAIPLVEKIWAGVFETTDKMLKVHGAFGFTQFEKQLNPKLSTMLLALNVLEQVLDTLYGSGELDPSENRMALNAKQAILLVQRVADALRANSEEDYNDAMEKLDKQAVI